MCGVLLQGQFCPTKYIFFSLNNIPNILPFIRVDHPIQDKNHVLLFFGFVFVVNMHGISDTGSYLNDKQPHLRKQYLVFNTEILKCVMNANPIQVKSQCINTKQL